MSMKIMILNLQLRAEAFNITKIIENACNFIEKTIITIINNNPYVNVILL